MSQITVDVGVKLNVLQSSLTDLQNILKHLEPDSSGFKKMQSIIAEMTREMEKFQVQTSKGFTSNKQFDQANRSVEKMEETLTKAQIAISNLKFSDIKLNPNQTQAFSALEQAIVSAEQKLDSIKEKTKQGIFSDTTSINTLSALDPKGITKSFDEIDAIVSRGVKDIEGKIINAKAQIEELNATVNSQKSANSRAENLLANGITSDDWGNLLNKTGTGFKAGGKQEFLQILKDQFQVSDADISEIEKLSFGKINEAFKNKKFDGIFDNLKKDFESNSSSLANLTKNLDEFEKLQQAINNLYSKINTAKGDGTPLGQGMIEYNTEIERVSQALANLRAQTVQNVGSNSNLNSSLAAMRGQLQNFANQLNQASVAFLRLQQQQQTFNSIKMAITNFMGFNQVLNLTKSAVQEAMNHIKQLDTVMNGIAIVTDMTTADLWNQIDAYSEMAQRYGTTIQGAYEVSKIYYQAGYETNDVLTLMNETLKLSKVSGLDYATTTDYMMTATRGFHMAVSEAAQVVDVYSALAANTAVSQQELAEAMSKTASSMESVGATFQESSAMIATMVAVTRESANNIGSALKSIGARYGELTKDPTKLFDAEGEAMSFNKVDTALKSVGISLQTVDHQFRDFTDVIMELAGMWDTLDSAQQRYIATTFAGNRQQSRFLALVSNKDLLQENMDVAAASEDTGTLQALKALDSLESKLNQVQVAYQQFYTSIGAEGVWKSALDGIKSFIDTLNSFPKLFGKIPLGAISVLIDVISTVKGLALSAFSEIATQLSDAIQKAQEQMQQSGQEGGNNLMTGLVGAVKSRTEEVQNAIKEATTLKMDPNSQISAGKEFVGTADILDKYINNAMNSYGENNFTLNVGTAIDQAQQLGVVSQQTSEQLRQMVPEQALTQLGYMSQELRDLGNASIEAGEKALHGTSAFQQFVKNSKHLASDLGSFGSALNMIGSLINTTSQKGQIASGSIQLIAGAFKAAQVGVLAFQAVAKKAQWSNVFTAAAGAVLVLVNAIATLHETGAEKLERLTKEAEEFSNQAKEAKANYNTLQRSINKLDELKQKRYDNVEATEEYQNAVDELAKKFPQLITGLDDVGNITIETANLEYELERARQASAQATLDAAEAERERAKQELKNAQETQDSTLGELKSFIDADIITNPNINSDSPLYESYNNFEKAISEIPADFWRKSLLVEGSNVYDSRTALDALTFAFQDLPGISFANNTPFISDLQVFREALESSSIYQENKDLQTLTKLLWETSEESDISIGEIEAIRGRILNLTNLTDDEEAFEAELNDLISTIESQPELYEAFGGFMDMAGQYKAGLIKIGDLTRNLESSQKIAISAKVRTFGEQQEEFTENLGEGNALVVAFLEEQSKNYKDFDSYLQYYSRADYDRFEQTFNDLGPVLQKRLLEMWGNRQQYTADDILNTLGIEDDENPIAIAVKSYFSENNMSSQQYAVAIQKKLKEAWGGERDDTGKWNFSLGEEADKNAPIREGLVALFNSVGKLQDDISTDLYQWIISVSDLIKDYYSRGMVNTANNLGLQAAAALTQIGSIEDIDIRNQIISSLNENGLGSVEGLQKTIDLMESLNLDDGYIAPFRELQNVLVYNIPLAIQAYTDGIVSDAENLEKSLKNMSSGLSISEAIEVIDKINAARKENGIEEEISLNDFDPKNGKFYFKNADLRQEYVNTLIGDLESEQDKILEQIEAFNPEKEDSDRAKDIQKLFEAQAAGIDEFAVKDYEYIAYILESFDLASIEENENGEKIFALTEQGEELLEEGGLLSFIYDNLNSQFDSAQVVIDYFKNILPADTALAAGDYQSYLREVTGDEELILGEEQLGQIASTGSYDGLDYKTQIKPLKDKLNSVYNSLISDVLSNGIENVRPEDYEGLIDDTFDFSGSYVDFVRRYVALTGASADQANDWMLQAIKKDNATSDAARKKAFQDLKIVGNALYGTEDQIFALAESLGIDDAENLLGKQQIDGTYQLNITEDVQHILDSLGIIEQSIPNQLKSYADTLDEATSLVTKGTTDFSKMQNFANQYAKALGLQEGDIDWQRLFVFDETTNSYVLSIDAYNNYIENQRQVLENAGVADEEIANILNNANRQFASTVDIGGYLKSDRREKARGDLTKQLTNYYEAMARQETQNLPDYAKQSALDGVTWRVRQIIDALDQGGAAAVEEYRKFIQASEGRDLTAEEVKNAYLAELTQYQNAFDELNEGIQKGSIVTNDILKTALQEADFQIDENGVVTSVGNMVEAYHNLYEGMKATNEATTSELNQAYLQLIEANNNKDKVGLEMLSSASNLDVSLLENFASTMGYHLEAMLDESGNVINGWANSIQRTGVNSYEITDWNRYLQQVEAATGHKIDQTSKEYIDSYIAWLDSQEIKTPEGKAALMTSLTANMNKLTREQIGQIALAFGKTYAEVESYLVKNADGTFDGRALLNSPEFDFDKSTPEYTSALKTLNDSLIEVNRQAEKNILEEAQSLGDMKAGDWINLTQLSDTLNKVIVDSFVNYGANGRQEIQITALDSLNAKLQQYGAYIENGLLKLDDSANIPAIIQEIANNVQQYGNLSEAELAQLADTLKEILKSYADLISGAIEGSLSNEGAQQLQQWAESVGLGKLTFIETADGLKIATDQAFELVAALQQVDSMQGKLVFNDLVDALSADKGGQFENISKTTAEIAKLEKSLAVNERELQELRLQGIDSSSETYQNLQKQNSSLREQINLAKQIQQRQSIDPSQYNFMDRELPDIMQGPINYWNSVGEAFASMNESAKTGRMDVQDFYNIVNEMSNLIAISGQPLEIAGIKLDGSAEQAAALIQKGMGALTNIDGKGVKINLEQLGIDFASGADGAKQNFADGVNALAKSQIAMLDAAIKVLEVVVAMEQLKDLNVDGGDNTLDLTDLFAINIETGEVEGWDKDFQKASANILKLAEEDDDLKQALEQVKIGNTSLGEMLTAAKEGYEINGRNIEDLGMSVDDYQTIMSSFYQAMLNGDYNLDSIQDSVWDILNKTLPEGTVIELGDRTIVVSGGSAVQIDWDSEGTKAGEQLLKDRLTDEVKTTKDALTQAFVKYERGEADSVEVTAVLSAKGLIEIDTKKGTVTIDGEPVDLNTSAAQQYIAETALEDQGVENITSQAGIEGGQYYATATGTVTVGNTQLTVTYNKGEILYHSDKTNKDYHSVDELMKDEYQQFVNELIQTGNENGANISIPTYEEWAYQQYNIHIATETKFTHEDGSEITDPANDPSLLKSVHTFLNQDHQAIQEQLSNIKSNDNGTYTLELPGGNAITVDASGPEEAAEKVQSEIESAFAPLALSVSAGITEAFTNSESGVSEAIGNAVASAITTLKFTEDQTPEIPEISATVTNVKITSIGGATYEAGEENVTPPNIDSLDATVNSLKLDATDIDVDSVGEQIQEALEGLDITVPVKTASPQPSGTPKGEQPSGGDTQSAATMTFTTNLDEISSQVDEIQSKANTPADMPINADADGSAKNKLLQLHQDAQKEAKKQVKINPIFPDSWKKIGDEITKTVRIQVTGDKIPESGGQKAGNVALSKGTTGAALAGGRTLMGELGPELVVSKGRYFVVGQNGPEMVNLDPDAIVFNHLQTRQLLANGKTGTHATPVTNERKATSLATGNASGPAMASASAALAALKQLRAMWQSLADASLKDLGGMPGGSGGGGGGGGGKTAEEVEAITHDVERWFNWQREIEESQEKINKLTKEYNLLTAQGISSQQQINKLKERASQLSDEINTRQKWLNEAEIKQTKLADEGNKGLAGLFYNFSVETDEKTGELLRTRRYLLNDDERNDNFVKYLNSIKANGKLARVLKDSGKIAAGTKLKYKTIYDQQDADAEAEAEYQAWLQTKKGKKASDKAKEKQRKKIQDKINKKVGTEIEKELTIGYDITSGASLMNVLQEKDEAGNNKLNGRAQYKILEELGIIAANPILMSGIDKSQEDWEAQVVENFYNGIDNFVEEWETNTDVIKENKEALLENKIAIQEINDEIRETVKPIAGVTEGLEAWYNELKRIEAIEEKINILSKKNNNLQNDHIANGKAIFENEMEQVKILQQQQKQNNDLYNKQIKERDNLVKKYKDLPINYDAATGVATFSEQKYNKIVNASYTDTKKNALGYEIDKQGRYVDKEGILRDSSGKRLDESTEMFGILQTTTINSTYNTAGRTLPEILKDITSQDATGKTAYNAEQQYNILKSLGLEKFLKYDEGGKQIYDDFGELTKEEMESAVNAGISRIQKAADDINDATSEINKSEEKGLDIQASLYEKQQVIIDKAIELENLVKDAIVQERQDAIDDRKELKDVLDQVTNKTIEGLKDNLEQEKKLFDSDKDNKELSVLQAQLAMLRSSGGSLAKIRDVENQIQDKQQEMYFTERENAIEDLEDTAKQQIEALETQIDIMQTSLDYQVEHGLIWAEVNRKISETGPESLAGFIINNQKDFLGKPPTEQAQELIRIIEVAQQDIARRNAGVSTDKLPKFAKGGEINFTGPAQVDGTKNKPEQIFNFNQMERLKEMFLDNLAVVQAGISGLASITNNLPNTNAYNSINNEDNGINIGQLEFHMEVKEISNDYDARRAGREAMEEMVRIARKTGNRSISRR